ncbi:hypothetical protein PAXRUDRAFT_208594 [Paxillus rubicundulus Ve08.2h10]|uniref:Uncharacterized protein n=1 Tax=Paxillus rubicundulus Ve08.2h10 TaxID=930991 RepID=A0A0D0DHR5_9AGAM|nr:hypothetical protein PAXRUDRAFT_208594 [Paxillus rubicundulus Ve08.2h10]
MFRYFYSPIRVVTRDKWPVICRILSCAGRICPKILGPAFSFCLICRAVGMVSLPPGEIEISDPRQRDAEYCTNLGTKISTSVRSD